MPRRRGVMVVVPVAVAVAVAVMMPAVAMIVSGVRVRFGHCCRFLVPPNPLHKCRSAARINRKLTWVLRGGTAKCCTML